MSEQHPESMPDPDASTSDWVDDQAWWMDHPELMSVDAEIEDATYPDWALDVIESHDFQAAYPSPVVPLWQLERSLPADFLSRRAQTRIDRLARLRELGAPQVIIDRELALVYRALAEQYWNAVLRLEARFKAAEKDDGT